MRRRWINAVLLGVIAAAIMAPVGIGLADSASDSDGEHEVIDPALRDQAKAEFLQQLKERQRDAAADDPNLEPPDIPDGTYLYIPPAIDPDTLKDCANLDTDSPKLDVCQLLESVANGEARSGAYTKNQYDAAIAAEESEKP